MTSTGVQYINTGGDKGADFEKTAAYDDGAGRQGSVGRRVSTAHGTYDTTHRKLKARHIQLIGIGYVSPHAKVDMPKLVSNLTL